jgi:hypothetical protein
MRLSLIITENHQLLSSELEMATRITRDEFSRSKWASRRSVIINFTARKTTRYWSDRRYRVAGFAAQTGLRLKPACPCRNMLVGARSSNLASILPQGHKSANIQPGLRVIERIPDKVEMPMSLISQTSKFRWRNDDGAAVAKVYRRAGKGLGSQ